MARSKGYWDTIAKLARQQTPAQGEGFDILKALAISPEVELTAYIFGKHEMDVAKDIFEFQLGLRNRYTADMDEAE